MAEFPALPLFTDAFIADTTHLTAAQTGAYLMLLICAWRTPDCRLPNNDIMLARYSRMHLRTWKANKDLLLSFWKIDEEGKIYQPRLLDERNYVSLMRNKNVIAGKISALKRKERGSTTVATKRQHKSNPHTHTHIEVSKEDTSNKSDLPEWLPINDWNEWIKQRKKKPTQRALELAIKELDKFREEGYSPESVLQHCIMNGYQGLFKPNKGAQHATHISNKPSWTSEGQRLAAKYAAEAERLEREEEAIAIGNAGESLCITEAVREN